VTAPRRAGAPGSRRAPRGRWGALAAGLATLALGACATAPVVVPSPAELPFHAQQGGFPLHWRLDRDGATVVATGVVELAAPRRYQTIALELRETDASGRVVSRRRGNAQPPGLAPARLWPFRLELTPKGAESRLEVVLTGAIPFEVPQPGR
jgi:hypothetical protein